MKNLIKSLVIVSGIVASQGVVFAEDAKPVEQPSVAPAAAPKVEEKTKETKKKVHGVKSKKTQR